MQHPDEGTIHSWLDGALSPDEAAQVEAHVKDCPQCAAAVAEARGFIAASSRILTALDNAPRGVMPAAVPRKRFDPLVWRVAAALLVVAAGTLVVVRSPGGKSMEAVATDSASSLSKAATAVELPAAPPQESQSAPAASAPRAVSPAAKNAPIGAAAKSAAKQPDAGRRVEASQTTAQGFAKGAARPDQNVAAALGAEASALSRPPAPARVADALTMERVAESDTLRVIGSQRRIAANVTVYEIAGDTVTLTESKRLSLSGVVATGVAARREMAGKAAQDRRKATALATPDSAVRVAAAAAGPPSLAPMSRAAQVDSASVLHTITWSEPATGTTFALTGRMPEARLQQIRIRIEQQRAAAEKNP
jgi:hypothetical protein